MSFAGYELVDGRIPGQRIATAEFLADSTIFSTTETELRTVTASLVSGRRYRISYEGRIYSNASNQPAVIRIRLGSGTGGTEIGGSQQYVFNTSGVGYGPYPVVAEWVATSTGSQTFALTGIRNGGTGTLVMQGSSGTPGRFIVEYVSG